MKTSFALGVTGFSLIAATYGMARFSWGLMMPDVIQTIPFNPRIAGIIAACSYLAYCLAITLAPWLIARAGAGVAALSAGLAATTGLSLLAIANSPLLLAVGLFIAGVSAGLASPALADAVSRQIPVSRQAQVNTLINAGTGAGIIVSVLILLGLPGGWRQACILFAVMSMCCVFLVLRYIPPARHNQPPPEKISGAVLLSRPMLRLTVIALISGAASAAWWSFGPNILHNHLSVNEHTRSLLWLISGGAGILAIFTGTMSRYISWTYIYRLSQILMALPLLLLAFSPGFTVWLFPAVAMCGAGYVTLSGVLLVYAAEIAKQTPAAGVSVAFFMLAAGQVVGSVLFGQLYASYGATVALTLFFGISVVMVFFLPVVQPRAADKTNY